MRFKAQFVDKLKCSKYQFVYDLYPFIMCICYVEICVDYIFYIFLS
jgi:hypothetical protein